MAHAPSRQTEWDSERSTGSGESPAGSGAGVDGGAALSRRRWLTAVGAAAAVAASTGTAAAATPVITEIGGSRTVAPNAAGDYVLPSGDWEIPSGGVVGTVVVDGDDVRIDGGPIDATGRQYGVVNRGFDLFAVEVDVTGGVYGVFVADATGVDLDEMDVTGAEKDGVICKRCTTVFPFGVGATNCGRHGFQFDSCTDVRLEASAGNRNAKAGILVEQCTDVALVDVVAAVNGRDGIVVKKSSAVRGDVGTGRNGGAGLDLVRSDGCRFYLGSNDNGGDGIRLDDCTDCRLAPSLDDEVIDNAGSGIAVLDSTDCSVSFLTVENNGNYGVRIDSSTGITLDGLTYAGNAPQDVLVG
jgi:hypothetical protein